LNRRVKDLAETLKVIDRENGNTIAETVKTELNTIERKTQNTIQLVKAKIYRGGQLCGFIEKPKEKLYY